LLTLRQRQEFPLLCFDVTPDILLQQLQRVCTGLGLDGDRATDFFEHTLINQSAGNDSSEQQVSEHSLALYAQLQGYCSLS